MSVARCSCTRSPNFASSLRTPISVDLVSVGHWSPRPYRIPQADGPSNGSRATLSPSRIDPQDVLAVPSNSVPIGTVTWRPPAAVVLTNTALGGRCRHHATMASTSGPSGCRDGKRMQSPYRTCWANSCLARQAGRRRLRSWTSGRRRRRGRPSRAWRLRSTHLQVRATAYQMDERGGIVGAPNAFWFRPRV